MYQDVIKITEAIFNDYKAEYLYIDPQAVQILPNEVRGRFLFNGSSYLTIPSHILNNTEAMFIFNQTQYVLFAAQLLHTGHISTDDLNAAYARLDGIVYKNMHFDFKRLIRASDDLTFLTQASPYSDAKGRTCYAVHMELADGAFVIDGTAVCLNTSIHMVSN